MTLTQVFDYLFSNLQKSAETARPVWIFPTGGYILKLSARLPNYLEPEFVLNTEKFAETLQKYAPYFWYPFNACGVSASGQMITIKITLPNARIESFPPISRFLDEMKKDVQLYLPFPYSIVDIETSGSLRGVPDTLLSFFKSPPGKSIRIAPDPSGLMRL